MCVPVILVFSRFCGDWLCQLGISDSQSLPQEHRCEWRASYQWVVSVLWTKKGFQMFNCCFFFFFQRFHQNWSCFLLEDLRLWIHYLFMMYYSSLWTQPAFLKMTKCLESKLSEVLVNNCRVCLQRSMQAVNLNTCRSAVLEIRVCIAKGLENVCFRKCSVGFFFCVLVLQILFIQWLIYAWGVPV